MAAKEGDVFVCDPKEGCGIEVTVTKVCGCSEECDLICCGKPMKKKPSGGSCGCCR